jgi:predicted nucleic acid-binding protein
MILVDTSIWIELIAGRIHVKEPDMLLRFRTCGPVLQEVFQGLHAGREGEAFKDSFLSIPRVCDPLTWELYSQAAKIYREGRRRGYTVRSSMDCLIAAIAIESAIPVWHQDRDFKHIARFTPLAVFENKPPDKLN